MATELVEPKRLPGGAFGLFLTEHRSKLIEACKGKPITAVSKLASQQFKAISGQEKAAWEKKYKSAKEKYNKDVEEYKKNGGVMQPIKRKKGNRNADNFEQKITKMHLFFMKKYKSLEEQVASAVAGGCKTKRKSSEKDWDITACVAKGSRLLARKQRKDAKGGQKPRRQKPQKAKAPKKAKDPDEPKKPAGGGYQCYIADNRTALAEECKGQPSTAISKLAADRWKKLSAQEKKPYDDVYKAKRTQYETDMKAYQAKQKVPAEVAVADAALAGA